ncbi:MAG TPA: NAD(P)H-binding protein [Candidatus Thermoplasmatota archaeon]|nr:NAD(P)H-binding protein [Candidatus Thermoplasmatota archaeon]
MASRTILVAGASGFIGRHLVPQLVARGHAVRALTRRPERYQGPPGVTVARGDVLDADSLRSALAGCDAAVYLVHSMEGGDFAERDRLAARNFREAAAAAGLERLVYLGGLGNRSDESLSPHLRSRHEVGDLLAGGGVPTTVLRAAIILGAGGASFEMLRELVMRLPVMVTPRWVESRCQPIALRDVLRYLVAALEDPVPQPATFDIGGPDVLTYRGMMTEFADLLGKRLLVVGVPVLTPRLSTYWVDLVTSQPKAVAHALIEGLRNDVVCENDAARRQWPFPLLPYREAVVEALRQEPAAIQRKVAGALGAPRAG